MRKVAERLVALEARAQRTSETDDHAAVQAWGKLRPHLATLMGNLGVRALLSRALALASAEVPWLRSLNVKVDGTLDGLNDSEPQIDSAERTEGGVVLLAHLLGLLVTFIGTPLTLRIVREVWPKLSFNGLDSAKGNKE